MSTATTNRPCKPAVIISKFLITREPLAPGSEAPLARALAWGCIDAVALCRALFSFHLPACSEPSHVHWQFDDEMPEGASDEAKSRSYIGGCSCIGSVRIVAGPDQATGLWSLAFESHESSDAPPDAEPRAVLWSGEKDGDDPFGEYTRTGGEVARPNALHIQKWSA